MLKNTKSNPIPERNGVKKLQTKYFNIVLILVNLA